MFLTSHLIDIRDIILKNEVVSIITPNIVGRCISLPKELIKIGIKCCVIVPNEEILLILKKNNYLISGIDYLSSHKIQKYNFTNYDIVMLEDLENESLNNNIIISMWINYKNNKLKVPKLVIGSDKELSFGKELSPVIYKINFPQFRPNIKYLQQHIEFDDDLLYLKIAEYAHNIYSNNNYDVLIFAPKSELIIKNLKQLDESIEIPSDYYKNYGPKKIFIVNDLTCMFLNIHNVGCVVDTMLEELKFKSFNGGIRYIINPISKQKANSRSSLFGCTYYRMCTQKYYNNLDEITLPEITRIPIHNHIIELIENNCDPNKLIKNKDIDEDTKLIINSDVMNIPSKLFLIKKFPLSFRNGMFLCDWILSGYSIYPGIVIASLIDCYFPSYFWFLRKNKTETQINKRKIDFINKYGGYNDLETSLNIWMSYFHKNIYSKKSDIEEWTYKNSLNCKKLIEVLNLVKELILILKSEGYEVLTKDFNIKEMVECSKNILLEHYQDMVCIRISGNSYFNLKTKKYYFLDVKESINKFKTNYPEKLIALIINEIPQERTILNIIKFAIDVNITYPESSNNDAQQSVIDALELLSKI